MATDPKYDELIKRMVQLERQVERLKAIEKPGETSYSFIPYNTGVPPYPANLGGGAVTPVMALTRPKFRDGLKVLRLDLTTFAAPGTGAISWNITLNRQNSAGIGVALGTTSVTVANTLEEKTIAVNATYLNTDAYGFYIAVQSVNVATNGALYIYGPLLWADLSYY